MPAQAKASESAVITMVAMVSRGPPGHKLTSANTVSPVVIQAACAAIASDEICLRRRPRVFTGTLATAAQHTAAARKTTTDVRHSTGPEPAPNNTCSGCPVAPAAADPSSR